MATVTAIIPTYNRANFLGESIEAVLRQTRPVDQLIIVDDGSTDHTPFVLARYATRATVLRQLNGGKSTALNAAMRHVTSEFVWICDDDDLACPGGLAHLLAAIERNETAPFAYGKYSRFYDDPTKLEPHPYYGRAGAPFLVQVLEEMFVYQFSMLVRTSALRAAGPFDETMIRSQDFDMLARLAEQGDPVFVPETVFLQRRHQGDRGSSDLRFSASQSHQRAVEFGGRVVRRYRDRLDLAAFAPPFATVWSGQAGRASLLARGLMCAQRSLWKEAIEDFLGAASIAGGKRPSADELKLIGQIVRSRMPWRVLAENPLAITALKKARSDSRYLRDVSSAFEAEILRWAIRDVRQGSFRSAGSLIRLAISVGGFDPRRVRAIGSLLGRHGSDIPAMTVPIADTKLANADG